MTSAERPDWLGEVLRRAASGRWCTRPGCTTCGAGRFRSAYLTAAAARAGLDVPGFRDARPFDAWLDLSDTDRSRIFDALVEGLRRLAFEDAHLDGVELILSDLFPPLLRLGVPANLPRELGDSPAGGVLDAMRAHDRERTVRRNRATAVQDATAIAKERGDLRRPQNRNY